MDKIFKSVRRDRKLDNDQTSPSVALRVATHAELNFFDLPAELRNKIYEYNTIDLRLRLFDRRIHKWAAQRSAAIPGLLLASRRCRQEYLPILLATAPIECPIYSFDFKNVMRVASGLYSMERKALRANENLVLVLVLARTNARGSHERITNLRRWAAQRADSLDRLPWSYRVAPAPHSSDFAKVCSDTLSDVATLNAKADDSVKWELEEILKAIASGIENHAVLQE